MEIQARYILTRFQSLFPNLWQEDMKVTKLDGSAIKLTKLTREGYIFKLTRSGGYSLEYFPNAYI